MENQETTPAAQAAPAPGEPTPTAPITLPEMPPAETFVGLVAYGVDTTNDQSVQIPLGFLADGVEACIEATGHAIEQTALAQTATTATETATAHAIQATAAANTAASDLEQLKTDCAEATTAANTATAAAETATTNTQTAATAANEAAEAATEQTQAAETATTAANTAAALANEAAQHLTDDVSDLVLTEANKPRIQELAGIDYSILTEQVVPGEKWLTATGSGKVYSRTFEVEQTIGSLPTEGKGYFSIPLMTGVNKIMSFCGYTYFEGDSYEAAIIPYDTTWFYLELREAGELVVGGRTSTTKIGKRIFVRIQVKYTK